MKTTEHIFIVIFFEISLHWKIELVDGGVSKDLYRMEHIGHLLNFNTKKNVTRTHTRNKTMRNLRRMKNGTLHPKLLAKLERRRKAFNISGRRQKHKGRAMDGLARGISKSPDTDGNKTAPIGNLLNETSTQNDALKQFVSENNLSKSDTDAIRLDFYEDAIRAANYNSTYKSSESSTTDTLSTTNPINSDMPSAVTTIGSGNKEIATFPKHSPPSGINVTEVKDNNVTTENTFVKATTDNIIGGNLKVNDSVTTESSSKPTNTITSKERLKIFIDLRDDETIFSPLSITTLLPFIGTRTKPTDSPRTSESDHLSSTMIISTSEQLILSPGTITTENTLSKPTTTDGGSLKGNDSITSPNEHISSKPTVITPTSDNSKILLDILNEKANVSGRSLRVGRVNIPVALADTNSTFGMNEASTNPATKEDSLKGFANTDFHMNHSGDIRIDFHEDSIPTETTSSTSKNKESSTTETHSSSISSVIGGLVSKTVENTKSSPVPEHSKTRESIDSGSSITNTATTTVASNSPKNIFTDLPTLLAGKVKENVLTKSTTPDSISGHVKDNESRWMSTADSGSKSSGSNTIQENGRIFVDIPTSLKEKVATEDTVSKSTPATAKNDKDSVKARNVYRSKTLNETNNDNSRILIDMLNENTITASGYFPITTKALLLLPLAPPAPDTAATHTTENYVNLTGKLVASIGALPNYENTSKIIYLDIITQEPFKSTTVKTLQNSEVSSTATLKTSSETVAITSSTAESNAAGSLSSAKYVSSTPASGSNSHSSPEIPGNFTISLITGTSNSKSISTSETSDISTTTGQQSTTESPGSTSTRRPASTTTELIIEYFTFSKGPLDGLEKRHALLDDYEVYKEHRWIDYDCCL